MLDVRWLVQIPRCYLAMTRTDLDGAACTLAAVATAVALSLLAAIVMCNRLSKNSSSQPKNTSLSSCDRLRQSVRDPIWLSGRSAARGAVRGAGTGADTGAGGGVGVCAGLELGRPSVGVTGGDGLQSVREGGGPNLFALL